jgi:hypothetical protein
VNKKKKRLYELRQWAELIHEPILIEHVHLLQLLQIMYNKCVKKDPPVTATHVELLSTDNELGSRLMAVSHQPPSLLSTG